jgi:hypothetical protein
MAVISHPPYSPDLTPCDFFLYPKMKLKLKGRRFDTIKDAGLIPLRRSRTNRRVFDPLTEKDFQEAFQQWKRRWDRCLHAGRNYFEGDGG